jgi:hypothetical protein
MQEQLLNTFFKKKKTKHKEDMGSTQASLSALRSFSIKVLQHSLKVFHIALHIITTMSDDIAERFIIANFTEDVVDITHLLHKPQ